MRVTKEQADFFKSRIQVSLPKPTVYLFESRTDDCKKGGDIDILVIGDRKLTGQEKRDIKIAFYKKFGEQKIDDLMVGWMGSKQTYTLGTLP